MNEVNYQPRVGSVCHRVFEQIEANGPMAEKQLAAAVDVDISSLRSSTQLACTNRAMVREAQGGELYYRSTRVRPATAAPAPAKPELASPAPAPADPPRCETPAQVIESEAGRAALDDVVDDGVNSAVLDKWQSSITQLLDEAPGKVSAEIPRKRPFAFALWSDGRLSLEIDGISHTLDLQETRKLFDYLDRMRVDDEGARG